MKSIRSKLLIITSLFISNVTFVSAETTESQVKQKKHSNMFVDYSDIASKIKDHTPPKKDEVKIDSRSKKQKARDKKIHDATFRPFSNLESEFETLAK